MQLNCIHLNIIALFFSANLSIISMLFILLDSCFQYLMLKICCTIDVLSHVLICFIVEKLSSQVAKLIGNIIATCNS